MRQAKILAAVFAGSFLTQKSEADPSLVNQVVSNWRDASIIFSASSRHIDVTEPSEDGRPVPHNSLRITRQDDHFAIEERNPGATRPNTRITWNGRRYGIVNTDPSDSRSTATLSDEMSEDERILGAVPFAGPAGGHLDSSHPEPWWRRVEAAASAGAQIIVDRSSLELTELRVINDVRSWVLQIDESVPDRPLVRGVERRTRLTVVEAGDRPESVGQTQSETTVNFAALDDIRYQAVNGVMVPISVMWEAGKIRNGARDVFQSRGFETRSVDLDPGLRRAEVFDPQIPEGTWVTDYENHDDHVPVRWSHGRPEAVVQKLYADYFDERVASIDNTDFDRFAPRTPKPGPQPQHPGDQDEGKPEPPGPKHDRAGITKIGRWAFTSVFLIFLGYFTSRRLGAWYTYRMNVNK